MLDLIKKQKLGTWITLGAVVLSLIALIIYGAASSLGKDLEIASASELFYDSSNVETKGALSATVAGGVVGLVLLVAAIVLGQFHFDGIVGKICDFVAGAIRVVAPALLMLALVQFLYASLTGLGWTFFSNEELEIYADAIKTGKLAITTMVFLVISCVVAIVAAFFAITKKDAE